MLGCAEQYQAFPQRWLVPTSPDQGEGAPPEDSSPAAEDLSTTRWESQVSSLWRHPQQWRISEGGRAMSLPPPDHADGWYI